MIIYLMVTEKGEYHSAYFRRCYADVLLERQPGWEIRPIDTVDDPIINKDPPPLTAAGENPLTFGLGDGSH